MATKQANDAKLEATKARDELDSAKSHNEHLQDTIENLIKEKELLIEGHKKVMHQTSLLYIF